MIESACPACTDVTCKLSMDFNLTVTTGLKMIIHFGQRKPTPNSAVGVVSELSANIDFKADFKVKTFEEYRAAYSQCYDIEHFSLNVSGVKIPGEILVVATTNLYIMAGDCDIKSNAHGYVHCNHIDQGGAATGSAHTTAGVTMFPESEQTFSGKETSSCRGASHIDACDAGGVGDAICRNEGSDYICALFMPAKKYGGFWRCRGWGWTKYCHKACGVCLPRQTINWHPYENSQHLAPEF